MSTARDSPTEGSALRVARGSTLSTFRGVYHQGVSPSGAARTGFLQDWTHSSLFPALLQGILGKALRAHEPRKRRRAWEGHLQDTPYVLRRTSPTSTVPLLLLRFAHGRLYPNDLGLRIPPGHRSFSSKALMRFHQAQRFLLPGRGGSERIRNVLPKPRTAVRPVPTEWMVFNMTWYRY